MCRPKSMRGRVRYSHRMISVIFHREENVPNKTVPSIFCEEDGRKVVKSGYILVIMDGRRCHRPIDMLKENSDVCGSESDPLFGLSRNVTVCLSKMLNG